MLEFTVLSYFSDIQGIAVCPCFRSGRPERVNFSHCLEESIELSVLIPQESVFGGVLRGLEGMKTKREVERGQTNDRFSGRFVIILPSQFVPLMH